MRPSAASAIGAVRLRSVTAGLAGVVIVALSISAISTQIRINRTQAQLQSQAASGQRSLTRQCLLLPNSQKLELDALRRGVIQPGDYRLWVSTAQAACGHVPRAHRKPRKAMRP